MSKAEQTRLNIGLSDKLANFLITQPDVLKQYEGCSYVVFSFKNAELNKLNTHLIEELQFEGKTVIKAEETNDTAHPWILTPIRAKVLN